MSFQPSGVFPSNPVTKRAQATKISSFKDKVIYTSGRTVIVRDLSKPSTAAVTYLKHVHDATVARFSPSGNYCASGDVKGTIRVWNTVGDEGAFEREYKSICSKINDLDWDGESKRIIAVGEGQATRGKAIMFDAGNSVGEITGLAKHINAVSIRQLRPYRAVVASDDPAIAVYSEPPFKFKKTIRTHTKDVQDVRYSPSGRHFASVGSDTKIFLYDGTTDDKIWEGEHKGSIFAVSWSPDDRFVFTSSADKTVKLWDVDAQKATTSWTVGSTVDDQQLGNTWNGESNLVSLSCGGNLNVFDSRMPDKPARIFSAPQTAIQAISPVKDDTFLVTTASESGRVYSYNVVEGESISVTGTGHGKRTVGLAASTSEDKTYSIGWDDKIREINDGNFGTAAAPTKTQPKSIAVANDSTVFVAELSHIEAFQSNQNVFTTTPNYAPSVIAAWEKTVAIGAEDNKIRLYDWDGKKLELKEIGTLQDNGGSISALKFSPDGKYLVAGDSLGNLILYNVAKKEMALNRWAGQTSRITSLAWTPDSLHVASGSLDTNIFVWSVIKPSSKISIPKAASHGINDVLWVGPNKLAGAGADGIVRLWDITFHA